MGWKSAIPARRQAPLERRLDLAALPVLWLVELLVWSAKDLPGPIRKIRQRRERTVRGCRKAKVVRDDLFLRQTEIVENFN